MIDYCSLPESEIPMSMRCLRDMLKKRGWKIEKLARDGQNNLILTRPDGKVLKIASSIPPTTSVYAYRLANNKLMGYELLRELDIPQPETAIIREPHEAQPMIEKYGKIVIKPIDGAHGNGVTLGITSVEQAAEAIARAEAASVEIGRAIMQPQLPLNELERRIICIDYKFVGAFWRLPAQVTGDGAHTVDELIQIENQTLRGPAYRGKPAYIDPESARRFLGEKVNIIPANGEKVRVIGSCNTGQGGTMEDCSADFPEEMRRLSERIAKAAELPVVGIDFYGEKVIELNASPALHHPTGDDSAIKAIEAYIDYLSGL